MGKNTGNGTRIGIVKGRTQVYNPKTDCYVKRDKETGQASLIPDTIPRSKKE